MKSLNDYLDIASTTTGSDRQTALRIGVTPQYLSQARTRGSISEKAVIKLAQLIKIDVAEIFLSMQTEKCHEKDIKHAVEKFLRRATAACFVMTLAGTTYFSDMPKSYANIISAQCYTLCA